MTDLLHRFAAGLEKTRGRAGEGQAESFQRLHNFDARAIFIPGAVTQINEDVETAPRKLDDLAYALRLVYVDGLTLVGLKMTDNVRQRIVILHRAVGVFVGRIKDAYLHWMVPR